MAEGIRNDDEIEPMFYDTFTVEPVDEWLMLRSPGEGGARDAWTLTPQEACQLSAELAVAAVKLLRQT